MYYVMNNLSINLYDIEIVQMEISSNIITYNIIIIDFH